MIFSALRSGHRGLMSGSAMSFLLFRKTFLSGERVCVQEGSPWGRDSSLVYLTSEMTFKISVLSVSFTKLKQCVPSVSHWMLSLQGCFLHNWMFGLNSHFASAGKDLLLPTAVGRATLS